MWNCLVLCVQTESGPQEAFELWHLSENRNTPGVPAISCCEIDEIWLGWWNHSYYITSGPMSIYLWSTGGAGDCAVMEMMRFMVAWPSFELWQVNKLIDFRGPTETGAATISHFSVCRTGRSCHPQRREHVKRGAGNLCWWMTSRDSLGRRHAH